MTIDEKKAGDRRAVAVVPDPSFRGDALGRSSGLPARDDSEGGEAALGRTGRRRRCLAAGIVAVLSLCLIVFSAANLFEETGSPDAGSLLRTTEDGAEKLDASHASNEGESVNAEEPSTDRSEEEGDTGGAVDAEEPESSAGAGSLSSTEAGGSGASSESKDSSGAENVAAGSQGSSDGESANGGAEQNQAPATVSVSVSVTSAAADGSVSGYASPTFAYGATAYDALCATGLSVAGSGAYVSSVGGLAERDPRFGASSGWMYSVNGAFPPVPCTDYVLQDGDAVQWMYVV